MPGDLYQRLGVNRNASTDEIRKAYKTLAKEKHPDRGGNHEEFQAIQEAHEVLTNDDRRRMYDMTGDTSDNHQDMGGMAAGGIPFAFMRGAGPFGMPGVQFDMGDLFGNIFGGGGGGGPRRRKADRGPNKHHDIGLRLADFYKGHEINLKFNQARKCTGCRGTGAEKSESCGPCGGSGMKTSMRQIGPGMIAQTRSQCDACGGEGTRTLQPCKQCHGKKYFEREKQLDIKIRPGMRDGEQLVFAGECSEEPEFEHPGDVVLTLRRVTEGEGEYDTFEWVGDDLWIRKQITYSESVLGFRTVLKNHPNGAEPEFVWRGGPLIHGAVVQMPGLGMPRKGGGFGTLFIQVMIIPPPTEAWSPASAATLQSVLGGPVATLDESSAHTLLLSSSESKLTPNPFA